MEKVKAWAYWLISEPDGNIYEAKFFQYGDKRLTLVQVGEVMIDLPDTKTLDRKLEAPLEFRWMN